MSAEIPVEVTDITAEWLENVLQPHAPDARLRSIDVVATHSGTTGHIGNMFADGATPGFLDWAMAGFAPGLRDVAYFLGGSGATMRADAAIDDHGVAELLTDRLP